MSHTRQHHIIQAADALAATTSHPAGRSSDSELLMATSNLASIAELVGQLVADYRYELAQWATVTAHLQQAHDYADDLARSLNHACGTLAFNTALQPAA
jgi:hypothetical protein